MAEMRRLEPLKATAQGRILECWPQRSGPQNRPSYEMGPILEGNCRIVSRFIPV